MESSSDRLASEAFVSALTLSQAALRGYCQASLGMFCPTDLLYNATEEADRVDQPNSPLYQLLGGKPSEWLTQAEMASATAHVTKDDPPIVLLYGSKDKSLVKPLHGERLKAQYDAAGVEAHYQLIPGAGHGGPQCREPERRKRILGVFGRALRGGKP